MKILSGKFVKLAATLFISLVVTGRASASPVTILDYSGTIGTQGVAVEITAGGIFQTLGGLAFNSFFQWDASLPGAPTSGKIKITNVALTGTAGPTFPGIIYQATSGGRLEALDSSNNLLLSVDFSTGNLLEFLNSSTGQFGGLVSAFGGLYGSSFVPDGIPLIMNFVNFVPQGILNGNLIPSTAFGRGLVTGDTAAVPEPTTMLLLGSGLLGAVRARRKLIA